MTATASQVAADGTKTPFNFKALGMRQDSLVGIVARLGSAQQNNRGLIQFPTREQILPALWPNRPPIARYWVTDLRPKTAGA
jgi:hypothetical protein